MSEQIGLSVLLRSSGSADDVVPPSGFSARLVVFVSGAMAFLAVFALALSLAANRLADRWGQELAQSATVRIVTSAPAERASQTEAALRILQTTAGVSFARALTTEEQEALLAPWLGLGLDLDQLPVPQIIEIVPEEDGFDAIGLSLRLEAEVPEAVFDDHSSWREPLEKAANRLNTLGLISIALLGLSTAAMVTLAANAALAANSQVVQVLRLVGATDTFVARAFVRRFTLRALMGAAVGVVMGMVAVMMLPAGGNAGNGLLTGLRFEGGQWFLPLLIPIFAALVAYVATQWSATRALKGLT